MRRGISCVKHRGFEAAGREVGYRVDLMTKGESWKFRADIPLKRDLRMQKKDEFPLMPLISVVVPLVQYAGPVPEGHDQERPAPELSQL